MSEKTNTNVSQETVSTEDLDQLLEIPGADVIMTTEDGKEKKVEKPTFFQTKDVDMKVFEQPEDTDQDDATKKANEDAEAAKIKAEETKKALEEADPNDPVAVAAAKEAHEAAEEDVTKTADALKGDATNFNAIVDDLEEEEEGGEEGDGKNKGGRPSLDKGGMSQLVSKLIESKQLVPFNDDKPLEEYTMQDFEELISANFADREKQIREEVPGEFFDSLPDKLKLAAKYVADGGQDLEGMFTQLAAVAQTEKLDASNPKHHERIVRDYLTAKQFGTAEEIQEEIDSYKDLDRLAAKAEQFKPNLDNMQEQLVQQRLAQQETVRQQQQQAAVNYADSVYKTLEEGKLGDMVLSAKVQNMLYSGLVQTNYPSRSGKQTNMLGHLLEKHQFVEPNHALIAEALWLLQDPTGYKAEISKGAKNKQVESTVRTLKTEQANKNSSGVGDNEDENNKGKGKGKKLQRPANNFFER